MPQINTFKSVNNIVSSIIDGTLYYGILQGLTFASGETSKKLLIEVPADVTCQFVVQGLTLFPYDDTFKIRMTEGITSLTTGTSVINVNMNRNYPTTPMVTFTSAPVGTYGSEGIILADFNSYSRREIDYPIASKILRDDVERILKANTKYLVEFTRTTDTTSLEIEFRWIWIEV